MKTRNLTIAALALLLASCGNEEILENNESGNAEKVPMTFTAGTPQTRTSLDGDGHAVNWTQGDLVTIYDGTTELCEYEATKVEGSNATLTGVAALSDTYTAFYPKANATGINHDAITFTLPAEQEAVAGGFANGLNPSWAQVTDGSNTLQFQNLCALVKFSVDDSGLDDVTSLTLEANTDGDALAGSLTYTIGTDGNDGTLAANDGASQAVTLKGTFTKGETYYFVVAPGTLTGGITLSYTDSSNGLKYLKTTSNAVTLTAGRILNLGIIDLSDASFQPEAITNTDFITAVEAGSEPRIGWEKEADGTVLLTNANKQAMAKVTTLDVTNKGLTDLSGIEYFTGLMTLHCNNNNLTSLDLTGLTRLVTLKCNNNNLTTLDLTGLTWLNSLECFFNRLTELDITQLDWLNDLLCGQQNIDGNITLYLTQNQYNYSWSGNWEKNYINNGVILQIRD